MKNNIHALTSGTTVVILAAGLGGRLKHNTKDCPKCLVHVAGTPILKRMIDTLTAQGVHSFVIAIGYLGNYIKQFVAENYPSLDVTFVENPNYASTGSIFSLALALDAVADSCHLLLIEGDVVLDPRLVAATLQAANTDQDAVTLLAAYEPVLSGTFALVENGVVSAWMHESVRPKDFPLQASFKTVNVTFIRKQKPLAALRNVVKNMIDDAGQKAPLEYAMQSLVQQAMQIAAVDTQGFPWFEVDTPEDLEIANGLFSPKALSI